MTRARRRGRWAAAAGLLLALALAAPAGAAHAHATLVFGELAADPDPPEPGRPFRLTVTLEDPSLAPVEDAVVFVELRGMAGVVALPAPSTEAPELPPPLAAERLVEVAPAVYAVDVTLPAAGAYHLLIRDQTFSWEEANASVVLEVGGGPQGRLPFILPPTQVAPRSLWTWLLWLVGLPLVAGAVVTVLVLTSSRPRSGGATEA